MSRPLWGLFHGAPKAAPLTGIPRWVSACTLPAMDIIRDADEQYGALLWEYSGGQLLLM